MTVLALYYWFNFEKSATVILGIIFLIDFLPALYLHLEYWYKNRGEKFTVTENEIIRYTDSKVEVFKVEEIENCILYKSASMDEGGYPIFSVEQYFYAWLLFRPGDELIITCLAMPKIDQILGQLKGVQFERKKRGFNPL